MADLGKAYVQIVPSAKGISGKIEQELGGAGTGEKAGNAIGGGLVRKLAGVVAAAGIGATIVKGISASIKEGAALEQSLGGVETLFKENADTVIKNASQAYRTAGMSANEYMENVTSFSASLLQSLGGDTAAAAKSADMALTDMSDNANKFGTDMDRITDAYQGFAKQNYTMLDNLKLGYGGTKTEMERLLADAEKISGVHYDISNLDDVYQAIHVIQEDLGVTGTTAEEASKTLSGSFASMKAAGKDFLGNLALGRDIGPSLNALVTSASTFLFDNLFPAIGNIISQLPSAIKTFITESGPDIASSALEFLKSIGQGIVENAPILFEKLSEGLSSAIEKISSWDATATGEAGQGIMSKIGQALQDHFPEIMKAIGIILGKLGLLLLQTIPKILTVVGMMLGKLGLFLLQKLGQLALLIPQGILALLTALWGVITNAAIAAWEGIKNAIMVPIEAVKNFIMTIWNGIKAFLQMEWKGLKIIAQTIWNAIKVVITTPINVVKTIIQTVWNAIKTFLSNAWNAIKNTASTVWNTIKDKIVTPIQNAWDRLKGIVDGIKQKLSDTWDSIKSKAKSMWDGIKTAITQPIETAKNTISGIVEKIKGFFPISIGKWLKNLPSIRLKTTEKTILGKTVTIPTGFEWNAKAMQQPYMFSNATLFGAGEAGDEILYGRSALMRDISKAVSGNSVANEATYNFNIYATPGMDPKDVANEVRRILIKEEKNRRNAWA